MKSYISLLAVYALTLSPNQSLAEQTANECSVLGMKRIEEIFESNFSKGAFNVVGSKATTKFRDDEYSESGGTLEHNAFSHIGNHDKEEAKLTNNQIATFTFTKPENSDKWYVNEAGRVKCTMLVNTMGYVRIDNISESLLKIYSDSPLVFILGVNGIKQISSIPFKNVESGNGSTIEIEPYGTIELGMVLDFGPTIFNSFINVSSKHPSLPIVIVPKGTPDLTKELSETAKSLSFPGLVTSEPPKINASLQFNKVEINKNGTLKNNTRLINKKPVAVPVSFNRAVFILKRSKLSIKEYMTSRVYFAPGEEVNVITDERGVKYSAYKND